MKKLLVVEIGFVLLFLLAIIFAYCSGLIPRAAQPVFASEIRGGRTLIIDAGHGGLDGGAVALDGTLESAVNLDIALKTDCILGLFGVKTILVRDTEDIDYPDEAESVRDKKVADQKRRLSLINGAEDAVLISIHQNSFPDDPSVSGVQVLYAATEGSRCLADHMRSVFVHALGGEKIRENIAAYSSIYLMKNVNCPAVLIECGFLSNSAELKNLNDEAYRLRLAEIIAAGYIKSLGDTESSGEVRYES